MGKTFRRTQSEKQDRDLLRTVERRLVVTAHLHGPGSTESHHAEKAFSSMKRKLEWVDA